MVVLIYVVFFYRTFVSPYSFRWKALYGTVTYPEGKVRGIDVSHYQEEIDWKRLETVEEAGIQEGDEIEVKLIDIDQKTGKLRLSRRAMLPKPEDYEEPKSGGGRGNVSDRKADGETDRQTHKYTAERILNIFLQTKH